MPNFICTTCGTQYAEAQALPPACAIARTSGSTSKPAANVDYPGQAGGSHSGAPLAGPAFCRAEEVPTAGGPAGLYIQSAVSARPNTRIRKLSGESKHYGDPGESHAGISLGERVGSLLESRKAKESSGQERFKP
jgi:hypothetical protein